MMKAHLLSQYSKEEAIALLQKFVSRSDSPGDETDSNKSPVPKPERPEAEPERSEPPEPERSGEQSQEVGMTLAAISVFLNNQIAV